MLDGRSPRVSNQLGWPLPPALRPMAMRPSASSSPTAVNPRPPPASVTLHPPSLVAGVGASTGAPARGRVRSPRGRHRGRRTGVPFDHRGRDAGSEDDRAGPAGARAAAPGIGRGGAARRTGADAERGRRRRRARDAERRRGRRTPVRRAGRRARGAQAGERRRHGGDRPPCPSRGPAEHRGARARHARAPHPGGRDGGAPRRSSSGTRRTSTRAPTCSSRITRSCTARSARRSCGPSRPSPKRRVDARSRPCARATPACTPWPRSRSSSRATPPASRSRRCRV